MKKLFLVGGSGDIGNAIEKKFKNNGWIVTSPSHSELDLEKTELIRKYFENKEINLDYDVVVFSAGWNKPQNFEEINLEFINKSLQINSVSFCEILKYLLPSMKRNKLGAIIAISSLYSLFSRKGRVAYAMSKHALNGLIKTLAIELAGENIKVNSISPGFIDTKMTRKNNDGSKIKELVSMIPMNRLGNPNEIANVAYFLGTEESNYLTGQNIIIDGGFSCGGFQK